MGRRRAAWRRGHAGEMLAALALTAKGWRVVARRHRTPLGEIDLIARRGRVVLIVEVKVRPSVGEAADAVSAAAWRRIAAAADLWLSRQKDGPALSLRFDLMAVRPWRWPTHLADAWRPER